MMLHAGVTDTETLTCHGTLQVYVPMSGLVAASADGNIEFINDSFTQLFLGYKHNTRVGKVLISSCDQFVI